MIVNFIHRVFPFLFFGADEGQFSLFPFLPYIKSSLNFFLLRFIGTIPVEQVLERNLKSRWHGSSKTERHA